MEIFIPTILIEYQDIIDTMVDKMIKECPSCFDDYFLVDELNDEINIKAFKKDGVDKICKKYKITPRDYCMAAMTLQNTEND